MISADTIQQIILFSCTTIFVKGDGTRKEYCQGTSFTPKCSTGEVIVLQSALYGTLRLGTCVEEDPLNQVGCSVDVLGVVDGHCSGMRECDIRVPNAEMDDLRTCKHDFTRYLEASFMCIKGELLQCYY